MNVVYAPRALRDLQGISAYLIERTPTGAINTLGYFPEIGPLVDDAEHRRMSVPRYPYVIFYRIEADDLLILHIRHTSRRPIDPASDL
jgi:toxin ParE1/3/4